jgi:signal-transduction protein with cAMP-binding, CBS, and nucleotidyltransferase domain
MTAQPQTVHPDEPFGNALRLLYEGKFRHLPVVEFDRPLGMVSVRDALPPELEEFVFEERRRKHLQETR